MSRRIYPTFWASGVMQDDSEVSSASPPLRVRLIFKGQ